MRQFRTPIGIVLAGGLIMAAGGIPAQTSRMVPHGRPSHETLLGAADSPAGFRETTPARQPHGSASRRRVFVRSRDGLRLEVSVTQSYQRESLRRQGQAEVGGASTDNGWSGLPLADWVRSTHRSNRTVAVLATGVQDWVITVRLTPAERGEAVAAADLFLGEGMARAAVSAFAATQRREPVTFPYYVAGKREEGLSRFQQTEMAPAAPILRAANLRVTYDPVLHVVRGWRGEQLEVTVAAGARQLRVRGKLVSIPDQGLCWYEAGKMYAPASLLANQVGLATYYAGPKPAFHIASPSAPRGPHVHLKLPAGVSAQPAGPLELLEGSPPGFRPAGNVSAPAGGLYSGRKTYVRDSDGLRLELEAAQNQAPFGKPVTGEERVFRNLRVQPTSFSGLPLGEWVRSSPKPYPSAAVIGAYRTPYLVAARISYPGSSRSITQRDAAMGERLVREAIARTATRSQMSGSPATYDLRGQRAGGLYRSNGMFFPPVVPVLQAAGLRVTLDAEQRVVRGWDGAKEDVVVAAGARHLVVHGRAVQLPGQATCWLVRDQVYAPVSVLAPLLGLWAYATTDEQQFHVTAAKTPLPAEVTGLWLPPGTPLPSGVNIRRRRR